MLRAVIITHLLFIRQLTPWWLWSSLTFVPRGSFFYFSQLGNCTQMEQRREEVQDKLRAISGMLKSTDFFWGALLLYLPHQAPCQSSPGAPRLRTCPKGKSLDRRESLRLYNSTIPQPPQWKVLRTGSSHPFHLSPCFSQSRLHLQEAQCFLMHNLILKSKKEDAMENTVWAAVVPSEAWIPSLK